MVAGLIKDAGMRIHTPPGIVRTSLIRVPPFASIVKDLLHALADTVVRAVNSLDGDPGAVTGTGASGSPTQAIDKAAEDAVLRHLDASGSDLNVLSEEAGFLDRGGTRTLVVDPVDGTYNAIRHIPLYATSLAVGDDRLSTVTHALVRNLATGDTYYAERGAGAFRNGSRVRTRPYEAMDALVSVYLGRFAQPESYDVARAARRVRSLGSAALDLCAVASGATDLYYLNTREEARLRVIDIAAGVLLVREAGGFVAVPEDGRELDLPFTLKARTNLVAVGDRKALAVLP